MSSSSCGADHPPPSCKSDGSFRIQSLCVSLSTVKDKRSGSSLFAPILFPPTLVNPRDNPDGSYSVLVLTFLFAHFQQCASEIKQRLPDFGQHHISGLRKVTRFLSGFNVFPLFFFFFFSSIRKTLRYRNRTIKSNSYELPLSRQV